LWWTSPERAFGAGGESRRRFLKENTMGFQLLRCVVALGGDKGNTVERHRLDPIAFPELLLLQFMHGEDAIDDIAVVGDWPAGNDQVLQRLRVLYPAEVMDKVFPGTRPRLPLGDSTIPECVRPIYVAPPTRPDNPDPVTPNLGNFVSNAKQPVVQGVNLDALVGQGTRGGPDAPLPEELASHADDDDADNPFVTSPPNPQLAPSDILHGHAKSSSPVGPARGRRGDVALQANRGVSDI
jgi:hypothetical protein